ncbi:uncharacterized protein BJ171DRAFT_577736 [Polychytrium aggregatum]|uniref:uncharacterized protein n=1 Tax=Polychytrium aggregatum TaxID=110093 RepID=UPI0022FE7C73|nr:uncharacterized protein BJ171DRAFT_577736 [Polychytrium aggregatum]KAI9208636.1 hypothetical protein BJ171DRAFT_577736 [Polychytrium aggregatum]
MQEHQCTQSYPTRSAGDDRRLYQPPQYQHLAPTFVSPNDHHSPPPYSGPAKSNETSVQFRNQYYDPPSPTQYNLHHQSTKSNQTSPRFRNKYYNPPSPPKNYSHIPPARPYRPSASPTSPSPSHGQILICVVTHLEHSAFCVSPVFNHGGISDASTSPTPQWSFDTTHSTNPILPTSHLLLPEYSTEKPSLQSYSNTHPAPNDVFSPLSSEASKYPSPLLRQSTDSPLQKVESRRSLHSYSYKDDDIDPTALVQIARDFQNKISLSENEMSGISYPDSFNGRTAVTTLMTILKTTDRSLALKAGEMLSYQKLFRDVVYLDLGLLMDSDTELYRLEISTLDNLIAKSASHSQQHPETHLDLQQDPWETCVSRTVFDSMPKEEKKRQFMIHEIIATERNYINSLRLALEGFVEPLRSSNDLHISEKENFIRNVFLNMSEIFTIGQELYERLYERQQADKYVIHEIGDIFLEFVPRFECYFQYSSGHVYGIEMFKKEKSKNSAFSARLEAKSKSLPLESTLISPTTRLGRYGLYLKDLIKYSPKDSQELQNIETANRMIKDLTQRINEENRKQQDRLTLSTLNSKLACEEDVDQDLRLMDDDRRKIREGAASLIRAGEIKVYVYLLDHVLLLTTVRREKMVLYENPILLDLIKPESIQTRAGHSSEHGHLSLETHSGERFDLKFSHSIDATAWATDIRNQIQKHNEQVEQTPGTLVPKKLGDLPPNTVANYEGVNYDEIVGTGVLRGKLIVATKKGVFMGPESSATPSVETDRAVLNSVFGSSFKKILSSASGDINFVQTIETRHDDLMIIRQDKTVYLYPVTKQTTSDPSVMAGAAFKLNSDVDLIQTGICGNRNLIVLTKVAFALKDNTVRIWDATEKAEVQKGLFRKETVPAKKFEDHYHPSKILSVDFMGQILCLGSVKGYEMLRVDVLNNEYAKPDALLRPDDPNFAFITKRESVHTHGIFKNQSTGDFLLCYDDIGVMIDKNRYSTKPPWKIKWLAKPQAFAVIQDSLIVFGNRLIEVRRLSDGKLLQLFPISSSSYSWRVVNPALGHVVCLMPNGTQQLMKLCPRSAAAYLYAFVTAAPLAFPVFTAHSACSISNFKLDSTYCERWSLYPNT